MDIFPCEIWEKVVRDLPAYDLINFCKSSDVFHYLLREKNVVINFDLGGCFDIFKEPLFKFLAQDIGYNHIKRLNINKIYWISLEEIRDIVRLLPQLEELRALDTILGMRNDDVILYKKLKKLAVSVESDQFSSTRETYRENLGQLKSLCIKFVSKYKADFRRIYYMFFNELRKLDELWIYDADDIESNSLRYDYIVCNLRCLKKLVIKSRNNLTLLDYRPFGLLKVFERRRSNVATICYVRYEMPQLRLSLRRPSLSEIFESRTEKSWNVIQSFLAETPCNFQDSIDINKAKAIKNTEFKELSFFHTRPCNPTSFVNSAMDILLSKHSRALKKLCITFCILQEGNVEQTEKNNVLRHIINNCQYLTDLEIVTCTNPDPGDIESEPIKAPCYNSAIIGAYDLISNVRYLQRLTLEIPSFVNGTFLKDVFLKCPELWYLRIISKDANEDLNCILYSHLNYAQKLREFRFENVHIDLDRLFSALNKVLPSRLQRVVIKCDYEHSTQLWPLEKLLRRNTDIILLVILVSKYNRHQINKLQELLNEYKHHPAKIYVAKTVMTPEEDFLIPEAHRDLLYFSSDVSVLHFTDF